MAEAVRDLVRFGLEDLRLNRLTACCPVQNWGSALVLEKAGLKRESRFSEHMLARGDQWVDAFIYGTSRGAGQSTRRAATAGETVEPSKKR